MQHRLEGAAVSIGAGTAKTFPIEGVDILVCNVDGSFYAVEDVCTHDGAPLDQGHLEGKSVVCPRHGATFDVQTGEALTLPAVVPLMTFSVVVDGNDLLVDC
ncbi:MAG: non-heme iron oxygenase ferredoxin subunit [Candidatus Eremiobacteraeota bacterium]|nr:non-heme iron oxygenase ferredoxin subunit [Candidatus Eremiobacteraeota bacterium]